jgi:lipoyl(octanoyl) transferase
MTAQIKHLGCVDYTATWQAMQAMVAARTSTTDDEIWLLEHPPVFTQGLSGKAEHVLDAGDIPIIKCDRGGQVTYHGPGQLIAYVLLDLRRLNLGPRELVRRLEAAIIATLASYDISGVRRLGAPGVYVNDAKIAALGLRLRNGYSYHGLALNVDMDLTPFARINPCGYRGLVVTSMAQCGVTAEWHNLEKSLSNALQRALYQADAHFDSPADNAPNPNAISA